MLTIPVQHDTTGRYEIQLLEPHRWELRSDGRAPSVYGTASAARSAAARLERSRRIRVSLLRSGSVILVVAVAMLFALGMRQVANPEYVPVVEFTGRMEAAFRAVLRGQDVESFRPESDGFAGANVDAPPDFRIQDGDVAEEPESPMQVAVLIGEEAGRCYSLRWETPQWPVVGILRPGVPCEPTPTAAVRSSYVQAASSTQSGTVYWDPLLPTEHLQARWFLPAMLALIGAGVWSAVSMSLAMLRGRSERSAPLDWVA